MQGWIKLYRQFLDWEWYGDIVTKTVFIDLLLNANHHDTKWQGQIIKKGELVTSVSSIASRNNLSIQQVRTALNKLQKTGEINKQSTNKNTLVIILNYAKYQGLSDLNIDENNNQTTNEQQSNNNQVTTNKNVRSKECKNERIKRDTERQTDFKYNKEFVAPTLDEVKKYIHSENLKTNPDDFFDYYTANGWMINDTPMADWKAMCRKWSRNKYNAKQQSQGKISTPPSYDLNEIKKKAMQNTTINF